MMMLDPQSDLRKFCMKCSWWSSGYYRRGSSPYSKEVSFGGDSAVES